MNYTDKMLYEDKSKILYSPYYAALAWRQHGTGNITAKDFLTQKIELIKLIVARYFGNNRDTSCIEMLALADSLSTTPFGFGGEKVLKESLGYDKDKLTMIIAEELNLSEFMQNHLDRDTPEIDASDAIIRWLDKKLEGVDLLTDEIKQEILNSSDEDMSKVTTPPLSPEEIEKTNEQERRMEQVIKQAQKQGNPSPLKYILSTKEKDFVDANVDK